MGQDIKYIICKENINVPINIIHFKEGNALVFPVLIEDNDFEGLSENIHTNPDDAAEFFGRMLCGGYHLEYPTRNLIEFIVSCAIKSFAFISFREIGELHHYKGLPVVFIADKLHVQPREFDEQEIHHLLQTDASFREMMNNESKYWSYEDAEFYYLNALKNA